jgi:hypothetical protein
MELRPIPFIEDARYGIDRQGRVHSLKEAKGRARGIVIAKWSPCVPLSLAKAGNFARVSAGYPFALVFDTTEVVLQLHQDGRREEFERPYRAAECIRHNKNASPERAFFKGGSVRATGDLTDGWYCIDANGSMHIFHGPSVAAEVFAKNA